MPVRLGRPSGVGAQLGSPLAPQRQTEATDGEIDALVHGLYGLAEKEIEIVEGADH